MPQPEKVVLEISWLSLEKERFAEAKNQEKLVFLEVGANWCHWCHVMDEKTYSDSEVRAFLQDNFVLCREDQDSRPDLSVLYRDWGWPAIIVLNANGDELLKLQGYQEKREFLAQLKAVVKNPQPLKKTAKSKSDMAFRPQEKELYANFVDRVDMENGAYRWNHKFLEANGMLHGLAYYKKDKSLKQWADLTIANSYDLVDPVWSGAYQYSTKGEWTNQHFEKLLRVQAVYIEMYARYGALTNNSEAIQKAQEIYGYCNKFLKRDREGDYRNSQNADVKNGVHSADYYALNSAQRLKQGVPSVDTNVYVKENAMLAKSFVYLWAATADQEVLTSAQQVVDRMINSCFNSKKRLFQRSELESTLFSLEDNLCMLEALILMSEIYPDGGYRDRAINLADAMMSQFDSDFGMVATIGDLALKAPIVDEENAEAALAYNRLFQWTGKSKYRTYAQKVYTSINKKEMNNYVSDLPLLLRLEQELKTSALHVVYLTNNPKEAKHREFLRQVLISSKQNLIFETIDLKQMNKEQKLLYEGTPAGTVFICTATYCSAPVRTVSALKQTLSQSR